jgi:hypothetical protein
MHFDWTISLGNVVTAVTFLAMALLSWRDLNWRMKILEAWKSTHEHSSEQSLANITMLRESIAKLTEIANGQERRLVMLEDRQEQYRRAN